MSTSTTTMGQDAWGLDPRTESGGLEARLARAKVAAQLFDRHEPPPMIGRFTVLRRIGAGAVGVVYAAYDAELDRRVAIKVLLPGLNLQGASERRARLRREAKALARLSHPAIVQVYEVGEHEGQTFVAMEFVEGITLAAWAKEEPRRLRRIVAVYAEAGRGLAAAHAAGIVHRDFKPENVIVGRDGRVRVLDFGLAAAEAERVAASAPEHPLESLTATGAIMGTPAYMAPEQFQGAPTDARSDQFSFAVSLFEAIYGSRPFDADTVAELVGTMLGGDVRFPQTPRTPARLRRALGRALSRRRDDRFASIEDLVQEIEHAVRPWVRNVAIVGGVLGVASLGSAVAVGSAHGRADELAAVADEERIRADGAEQLLARREEALTLGEARLALERDATLSAAILRGLPEDSTAWASDGWSIATEAQAYGIAERVVAIPSGYEPEQLAPGGRVLVLRRAVDDSFHLWWPEDARTSPIRFVRELTGSRIFFSIDGRVLVAHDAEGVKRWDAHTGVEERLGPPGDIAAVSDDGRFVVRRAEDTLVVEDTETGDEHPTGVWAKTTGVRVTHDGRLVVHSATGVEVLDPSTGEAKSFASTPMPEWPPTRGFSESIDLGLGRNVVGTATDLGRGLLAFSSEKTGPLWLVDTTANRDQVLAGLPFQAGPRRAAFTADGRRAAVATYDTIRHGSFSSRMPHLGEVRLVDLESGVEALMGTITDVPTDVSWSEDGGRLLVATADALHVIDWPTGRMRQIRIRTKSGAQALASFRDSERIAAVDATAWRIFRVGRPLATEPQPESARWISRAGPDGAIAWLTDGGTVALWRPGEEPQELGVHEDAQQVAVLGETGAVVTVGPDGVRRFGPGEGWVVREPIPMLHAARLSDGGTRLATRRISEHEQRVRILDLETGSAVTTASYPDDIEIWLDGFSPDADVLFGTRRSGAEYSLLRWRSVDASEAPSSSIPRFATLLPHRDGRVLMLPEGPETRWILPDGTDVPGPVLPISERDEGRWSLSPDESMLALVTSIGSVSLIDLRTGARALARVGQTETRLSPSDLAWSDAGPHAGSIWFIDGLGHIQHVPLLPRDAGVSAAVDHAADPRARGDAPIDWKAVAD